MRYALVDNATLEAAKKMEGKAVTKNALDIAGHILALENLIRAILFFDQILYLDQNIGKKNQSNKLFESFQRADLSEDAYKELLYLANKMTDDYLPCIEGGRFTDERFGGFFHALDLDIRFVWERKSGIFYLTPRIIPNQKASDGILYKKLFNMILAELSVKSFQSGIYPRIPLLYDSEGQIINNCYKVKEKDGKAYSTKLSPQTDALFKALNYMAFRSNLHLLAAVKLNAGLVLSPVRSILQCCDNTGDGYFKAVRSQDLPLFSLWIAEHMGEGSGFIQAAFQLREEKEFMNVRRNGRFGGIVRKYRVKKGKGGQFGMIGRSVRENLVRMEELGECLDAVTSKVSLKTDDMLRNIKVEKSETLKEKHRRTAPV